MKDVEIWKDMTIEEKAMTLRKIRMDVRKLEALYSESGTPKSVIQKFQKSVGKQRAFAVIASLVNANEWDGRICMVSREWAKRYDAAWSGKAMHAMCVDTSMHRCHLDELAYTAARMEG